jgi:hypothetical protein
LRRLVASSTGGKSPLAGVHAHLQGHLKGLAFEFSHDVEDRDLAAVDPTAIGGLVDGLSHFPHGRLKFRPHPLDKLLDAQLMVLPIHGWLLLSAKGWR